MVIDADGKVHYITPDALDPKTGELTVTFTALGSVVILEKAPIVSKNLESDKYENEKVKAAAEQFKSAEEGTAVSDIFAAAGEGTTVKDQNGEDVDISQYKTSTGLKFGFEKVEGSDRPVLVIKGTFNGLGPVALASKAE